MIECAPLSRTKTGDECDMRREKEGGDEEDWEGARGTREDRGRGVGVIGPVYSG